SSGLRASSHGTRRAGSTARAHSPVLELLPLAKHVRQDDVDVLVASGIAGKGKLGHGERQGGHVGKRHGHGAVAALRHLTTRLRGGDVCGTRCLGGAATWTSWTTSVHSRSNTFSVRRAATTAFGCDPPCAANALSHPSMPHRGRPHLVGRRGRGCLEQGRRV